MREYKRDVYLKMAVRRCIFLFFTVLMAVSLTACAAETGELSEHTGTFPYAFTAKDLYENDVTEQSLGEKEIFFVHLWATWCPPCLVEMPDIGKIAEKYADRVGFIGLLVDYDSNRQGAIKIKESAGVTFVNIDADTKGLENVLAMLNSGYVPTTVILNRDGEIIGDAIIGARGAGYGAYLDSALD
ncbi:MAG: TlpA family protein disulfide reductase [Synergistaceae bacterium]|nr:TlpA family protein disulfide reductase [Synergistaceae bacterium]